MSINTLHKGDYDDDNNNNNVIGPTNQNREAGKINSTNALALFKDLNFDLKLLAT